MAEVRGDEAQIERRVVERRHVAIDGGVRPMLLVEDNPDDVALTVRAMEKNHVTNPIVVATDGVMALERLLPDDGGPGLDPIVVLLDLNLPKIDGLEVLRRIRADERTRTLPVVVLTSSSEERDRAEAYSRGVNSYVAKPVDFPQFVEAARLLSVYWLALNEPPPSGHR